MLVYANHHLLRFSLVAYVIFIIINVQKTRFAMHLWVYNSTLQCHLLTSISVCICTARVQRHGAEHTFDESDSQQCENSPFWARITGNKNWVFRACIIVQHCDTTVRKWRFYEGCAANFTRFVKTVHFFARVSYIVLCVRSASKSPSYLVPYEACWSKSDMTAGSTSS